MDIFNGMHPLERKKIGLVKAAGQFIPYNGEAPEIFSQPLVISDNGNAYITGVESSDVSALVFSEGILYKIKRCKPVKGKIFNGGPWGGIPRKNCLNELYSLKKISAEYGKYDDIAPPLSPTGMFEHEMKFSGDNVCSGIMKCGGDTRISEVEAAVKGLHEKHPELWDYEYLDRLFSGIAGWAGFNQRIMEEAQVAPIRTSFDLDNYAIYHVNEKGFGVGRVDLGSALHGNEAIKTLEMKKEFDLTEVTEIPRLICDVGIAKTFGIGYKDLRRGNCGKKEIKLSVSDSDKEWKEESEKEILLHVNGKRFDWIEKIKKEYLKYAEGSGVPEPIGKEIINPLFC